MSRQEQALIPQVQSISKPSLDRADIVVIGNGIAGLTAAVEARRLAPDKRIVIVTDQVHPTINTPALKQFAVGKLTREQLLAYPPGTERMERIHVVSARVEEIHANSKYITMSGNRGFGYQSLLIATGSAPNGLPASLPGREFDGVLVLHRLQDYLNLRRRQGEVSEAVIIGGGVHAIETVMGLLHWGIRVNWLIRSATVMPNMLDQAASEMVLDRIRHAGAKIYTGTQVEGIVGRVGSVAGVITNTKEMIPCELVLSCTGTRPVMTLADHCSVPLKHKNGIIVDDQLRTSVPNIYAAGDVAALQNPLTGAYEPRAQWYEAVAQGRIAGAMLAGQEELAQQPFGVHWHATLLGDLSMLTVGSPMSEGSGLVTLTNTSQGGYRRMVLSGDRLVGYLSLGNAQPDSLAIKRIIDEGLSVRDITKSLLKGKLDARQYFSQQRSQVAQSVLSTGMLPRRINEPMVQMPLQATTGPIPVSQPVVAKQEREVGPRVDPSRLAPSSKSGESELVPSPDLAEIPYLEEISPFTGSLPAVTVRNTESLSPIPRNVPAPPEPILEEDDEVSPFTGNLPAISRQMVEESIAASQTSTFKNKGNGLWAYAEKTGASSGQGNMPEYETDGDFAVRKRQASQGLLSYIREENSSKVEK